MRSLRCVLGLHPWTAWTRTAIHWRLVTRRCPRCNIEQEQVL